MSKGLKIIIFSVCLIALLTIFVIFGLSYFTEEKTEDLILTTNSITLEVDDQINLNDYFELSPANSKTAVLCLLGNSSYAQISSDKILTAKAKGNTSIFFKVNAGNGKYIEKNLSLIITEKSLIPTTLSFEKEVVNLGVNTTNIKNELSITGDYNVNPTISYSTTNVCTYNYLTGEITPLNVGTTTITVEFEAKGNATSKSFTVNVKQKYLTMSISGKNKEGEYYIFSATETVVEFDILVKEDDEEAEEGVACSFGKNETGAEIEQVEFGHIVVILDKSGESILKISCEDDESVFIYVKIIKTDEE